MRRGDLVPRAFQAPVDVHASADGQVYMFRRTPNESGVSSEDEESVEMTIAQVPQDPDQDRMRNVQLLEREVLEGDNLTKLALQYGCKVADIKRVNNLIQEQDLFALKYVKIPVQKHSFLTESNTDFSHPLQDTPHSPATPVKPQDRARVQPHLREVTDFLKEVDQDIERLIETTNDPDEIFPEASERQQRFGFRAHRLGSHGADWGIQWWNAVVAMLLIGIILPIFYVIYFKTKDSGADGSNGSLPSIASTNISVVGLGAKGSEHLRSNVMQI
ncbi:lysM and putative peptidoglycan-binding domain-containing protein 4 [Genypterus blacodes]|uniref:lysM and putative peptidoglycan-binding domain-containing protein 4 n=1 Tax=Genypterus blacodes TaxID=154954 RepID=UPI003F769604